MNIPTPTDAANHKEGRGAGRAFLLPDEKILNSLDELIAHTPNQNRLTLLLRNASTDRLTAALTDQIMQLNTEAALRVSSELTARGIAPAFRNIPIDDEWLQIHWSGVEPILMLCDLQWIVSTYPDHVPEWKRAEGIFDPRRFMKTAEYLHWGGRRTPGQIAKALALTEQQQRECVWIQCLHVERWRQRLLKRFSIARARIVGAIRDGDNRPRLCKNRRMIADPSCATPARTMKRLESCGVTRRAYGQR